LKVLVACEFSAVVTNAFRAKGHEAYSCDIVPTEGNPKWHYQGKVEYLLYRDWDLLIAFPPCTYLATSGARWFSDPKRQHQQKLALEFVNALLNSGIPRIALENPVGVISSKIRKPDQIIHPWQFGHGETKRTCLWLKGLPLLQPTCIVEGRQNTIHWFPDSKRRRKERSRTFPGIALAMAAQWG
jgi:site-specific DNA-cytosine methylase